MAADRYAPAGKIWLCMMCGKTAKDYCTEERGWDESCALNCILVDEATKQPTEKQAREFAADHARRLGRLKRESADLLASFEDGTWRPDSELLALAEQIVREPPAKDGVEVRPVTQQEDQWLRDAAKRSGTLVAPGKRAPGVGGRKP